MNDAGAVVDTTHCGRGTFPCLGTIGPAPPIKEMAAAGQGRETERARAGGRRYLGDGTGSVICCSITFVLVPSLSSSQKVASPFCKDIAEVEEVPLPPLFIRWPSHAAIAFSRHNFYNGLARLCSVLLVPASVVRGVLLMVTLGERQDPWHLALKHSHC